MTRVERLLSLLADGAPHSGEALGEALGVTRAAVWKLVRQLQDTGVPVESVPGKGYRLQEPVELLDSGAIRAAMGRPTAAMLRDVSVERVVDSTNRRLFESSRRDALPQALLAEAQSAGRGRRGRDWHSPFGRNLYLSVAWPFDAVPGGLGGLSLAVGIAVADVLSTHRTPGLGLKWPNDLLVDDRKLGGILVELQGEPAGPCTAVVGLGLNLFMDDAPAVEQPWTALAEHVISWPGRNVLAGQVLDGIVDALSRFGHEGFPGFVDHWPRHDLLAGKRVRLFAGNRTVDGIAAGVDQTGCLLLERDGRLEPWSAGEVSLRPVQ
ncbi:bifunctional biotin--[acetyl-CoA-carboxylase] ligase/biotin operon repressor BirA [Aquisalimonas asiatica]|uniref:Bifunctional ligase/repressor BirA n=1 Tax=Aquisalimonas asiatica TaxID=406100 RepID=A0A1H8U0M5_9GAMM|nr:bifunctional biotin--[acetyl-CoA-carboxylase] ligase/biotin operon repressor BirA [Aquisalimonas asiatica]SEO96198.1 BirA family transcriptional regulator, biotin operon repressor / biotin-[acetyl-CoA-carboxylase] ligase [Aquisalimonas asiatica]